VITEIDALFYTIGSKKPKSRRFFLNLSWVKNTHFSSRDKKKLAIMKNDMLF